MAACLIKGGKNLQKFLDKVKDQDAVGLVGFFPEAIYDNGIQVAQVAVDNEFGKVNSDEDAEKYGKIVPPRSFMQKTFNEQNKNWRNKLAKLIKEQKENIDVKKALNVICKIAKDNIQETIDWWAAQGIPRNSPMTIARKGFDSPLIEKGKMRESVSYVVKTNES